MVRDDEERGALRQLAGRQGREELPEEPVHVVDRPVRLRRARAVQVLEAVDAEEVQEHQPRLVATPDVRRELGHHRVLQEALGQLRPLALAVERIPERRELGPDGARGLGLEHALVLEERQVEVEPARLARGWPVDRRGPEAGRVRDVVDRRGAQEVGRVVDGVAGEVFARAGAAVEDAVADDAVAVGRHAGDEAHVGRPGRAREHGLHPGGDDAPLREGAEPGHARRGIPEVEGGQAVDADDDRPRRAHAESSRGGRDSASSARARTFRHAAAIHVRS